MLDCEIEVPSGSRSYVEVDLRLYKIHKNHNAWRHEVALYKPYKCIAGFS